MSPPPRRKRGAAAMGGVYGIDSKEEEESVAVCTNGSGEKYMRRRGELEAKTPSVSADRTPPPGGGASQSSSACPPATASGGLAGKKDNSARIMRVPLPESSTSTVENALRAKRDSESGTRRPACTLLEMMSRGRVTDWDRVKRAAGRIADPDYSLAEFHNDIIAFPELDYYLLEGERVNTASGRSGSDEYQRTIGAFFAIYWLLRLRRDGKDGFTFGVDDCWRPIAPDSSDGECLAPVEKRLRFYHESHWADFERLLLDAGLIVEEGGELRPCMMRITTLLALTAVHDIMKVEMLCPKVQAEHAPYHGYTAGTVIRDHDQALSYVMDHFPDLLPSFNGLEPHEKRAVQFTQSQLSFNNGWLVQAEAPPGATFTTFRNILSAADNSQIESRDIALYFVHWLTDLAGAEPTPLGGCEKFVVKFPLPVLNSFLRSFQLVQKIAHMSETDVMEEYLKVRWAEHEPPLGPLPMGSDAVAKMRLVCQAQANAAEVLGAMDEISEDDREVLAAEMSRTGCVDQSFTAEMSPQGVRLLHQGPALLVYYGPAYLQQSLRNDCPASRLNVLAEVYRRARALWPADVSEAGRSVIVRIDSIKGLCIGKLRQVVIDGELWLLVKHNSNEASVEKASRERLNELLAGGQRVQILDASSIYSRGEESTIVSRTSSA